MHGIVSLLDNDHYQLVEELWAELVSMLEMKQLIALQILW